MPACCTCQMLHCNWDPASYRLHSQHRNQDILLLLYITLNYRGFLLMDYCGSTRIFSRPSATGLVFLNCLIKVAVLNRPQAQMLLFERVLYRGRFRSMSSYCFWIKHGFYCYLHNLFCASKICVPCPCPWNGPDSSMTLKVKTGVLTVKHG